MERQTCKILLVDDDGDDYLLVREMLAETHRQKFEVVWVSDYAKALEECLLGSYDAILVDYDLGGSSGLQLIRDAVGQQCRPPIIMLTGFGSYEVDLEAMRAGAVDYLGKNEITPALLERTIRYAIDHRKSEEALRANRQELFEILESISDGFLALDREWRFVYINRRAAENGYRDPKNLIGKIIWEEFPSLVNTSLWVQYHEVMEKRQPMRFEMPGKIQEKWYDISIYPTARGISIYWIDQTEQKSAERVLQEQKNELEKKNQQLEELFKQLQVELEDRKKMELTKDVQRQLIQQREMERLQIARDLHDGPLQDVIGATFTLVAAMEIMEKNTRLEKMQQVQEVLHKNVRDLRQFCNELRPPTLAVFGLEGAIRAHANTFQARYPDMHLELTLRADRNIFADEISMALYRVYQEAMNNILKHAKADEISILLEIDEVRACMEVKDNGIGFVVPQDWTEIVRKGHLGIIGMQERLEVVGGSLTIISQPTQGTVVRFCVPIQ
jgi:signal transduction histidine kinase